LNEERNIESLNGLRGIAVLFVLLSHTGNSNLFLLPHLNLSGIGQYGVIIFFFLSSFLLSRPFFQKPDLIFKYREWTNYALRRILRVVPLYFLIVLLDFFLIKTNFPDNLPTEVLSRHLLFIKGVSIYWSVPVEMQFYLLLPVIVAAFIICSKNRFLLSLLLLIISTYFVLNGIYANTNSFWETLHLHRYVPCFIAGIVTSFFHVRSEKSENKTINKNVFEIIAIFCILVMVTQIPSIWFSLNGLSYNSGTTDWSQYYKYRHLLTAVIVSIAIYSFLHGTGHIRKILSSKALTSIGKISFSMYLTHMLILSFILGHINVSPHFQALLTFFITYLISLITFYLVEKPFMNMAKMITSMPLVKIKRQQAKA